MEEGNHRDGVYSKAVRAGKRTYFFDVRATKSNDLYLIMTESKKMFDENGDFHFEKHKIFLYREDFSKFIDGLKETFEKISELKLTGQYPDAQFGSPTDTQGEKGEVTFDDL